MIFKLIVFIIAVVAFAFFTGFNLENKCDVWLFWKVFKNVPAFMNSIISFAFGVLCTLPIAMVRRVKKSHQIQNKEKKQKVNDQEKTAISEDQKKSSDNNVRASLLNKIQKLQKSKTKEE